MEYCQQCGASLPAHAAFCPRCGHRVKTAGKETPQLPMSPGLEEPAMPAAAENFSQEAGKAVSAGLWKEREKDKVITPENARQVLALRYLKSPPRGVTKIAFSHDGSLLGSAGGAAVYLLDCASGALLHKLKGHNHQVNTIAFSPDGRLLASGSKDRSVCLWNPADGTLLHTLKGHNGSVNTIAFSSDGRLLASGSSDKTVNLWDPFGGNWLYTLKGHKGEVHAIAFSPDGCLLASKGLDDSVRLWDSAYGALLHTLTQSVLAQSVEGFPAPNPTLGFSPDGRLLASGTMSDVHLWDPASGKLLLVMKQSGVLHATAFSPDGCLLASGGSHGIIYLWNAANDALLQALEGQVSTLFTWAPSSYDKQSASETGKTLLQALQGHKWGVLSLAFSPDGRLLASGGEDRTVKLWDPIGGTLLHTLKGHKGVGVKSIAFSPDGHLLASEDGYGGPVRLWGIPYWKE